MLHVDWTYRDEWVLPGDSRERMGNESTDLFNIQLLSKSDSTAMQCFILCMILWVACVVVVCLNTLPQNKSYVSSIFLFSRDPLSRAVVYCVLLQFKLFFFYFFYFCLRINPHVYTHISDIFHTFQDSTYCNILLI